MGAKRELIEYGYIAYTGSVMSDYAVDRYNYTQERINKFIDKNMPIPEHLLNDSFAILQGEAPI